MMLMFEGREIETDADGYLKNSQEWSEPLAEAIAAKEGITLAVEHWEVVRFVREFYLEFNTSRRFGCWLKPWQTNSEKKKAIAVICIDCFQKGRLSRQRKLLAYQSR
ncbi:TusE/DsrC/DsvC family sulfur relay protein [Buttiauxella agrestis]